MTDVTPRTESYGQLAGEPEIRMDYFARAVESPLGQGKRFGTSWLKLEEGLWMRTAEDRDKAPRGPAPMTAIVRLFVFFAAAFGAVMASAQVLLRDPPPRPAATCTASDGSVISRFNDSSGRPISIYGLNSAKQFYDIEFTYPMGGINYYITGPSGGQLQLTVLQGSQAVSIQATVAARTEWLLIYQLTMGAVPNIDPPLEVYLDRAIPPVDGPPGSGPFAGPAQAYANVGGQLRSAFPEYEAAVIYLTPALADVAGAPGPAAGSGYTIITKLEAYQERPRKVCSIADTGGSAYGLLVCIGVGIQIAALSSTPDQLYAQSGQQPLGQASGNSSMPQKCLQDSDATHKCAQSADKP